MRQKFCYLSILLLFAAASLPLRSASADLGPKPSMVFLFEQELAGEPLTILSGVLLECEQPDCQDGTPLMEAGPQRFQCTETQCSAKAYGFSKYHQLEIQFSDGITRRSNIFRTVLFNSYYSVTIRQDDLLVKTHLSLGIIAVAAVIFLCAGCLVVIIIVVVRLVRRAAKKK